MKIRLSRAGIAVLFAVSALPASADSLFTVRRTELNGVPPGRGQCDIRLQVDDTVEVAVDGDRVYVKTVSGQDARDNGSECNVPLPRRPVAGFNFEVKERRGDIELFQGPTPENGGKVFVRIHDGMGGFGRYAFRLSWDLEGDRPRFPSERDDSDARRDFRIVNARWGVPGRSRDVTRILTERIRNGRLHIQASNPEMGFDPALGMVKELTVVYEFRGSRQEVRVPENGFLDLPAVELRDDDAARDFHVVNAFWGVPGRGRDVTGILADRVRGGRLHIQASNLEMGFDPAQGMVKELTVVYEIRGRRQEVRIPENGFLDLP